ncbi:MAG: hypothetical protein JXR07_07560 [Reichenbachiella sp.]
MKILSILMLLSFLTFMGKDFHAEQEYLTINGTNIWVRSSPTDGKVVMKLNEGDRCRVFGKKRLEIIRGTADYWYEIEFQGKRGWVFGSQTSRKMEDEFRIFNSINELVRSIEFDSNNEENWEGDPSVIKQISTNIEGEFEQGELSVVSFDSPGFMSGRNFSWIGFIEGDLWKCWEFPGEKVFLKKKGDQWLLLMHERMTGGAFTLASDYTLYSLDAFKKTIQVKQEIFEFAEDFEDVVYGKTTIALLKDNTDTFRINETIDHSYDKGRKGTFEYTFRFDEELGKYQIEND